MGLEQKPYYVLTCDQCQVQYKDDDTENFIVHDNAIELGLWAVKDGWCVYRNGFRCDDCKAELARADHDFVAESDGSSLCAICNEWFDHERHPDPAEFPGQLALPIEPPSAPAEAPDPGTTAPEPDTSASGDHSPASGASGSEGGHA